jgi:ATP-dependent DNA ligase
MRAVPLRSRSCIIDGEAVACGDDGIALFEHIRCRRHDASIFLYAFDLVELNGDDVGHGGLKEELLEGAPGGREVSER